MAPSTSLASYHKKRNFERTAEPRGKKAAEPGFSYVIQKHAARRLHYDFRLELDGVLLSWAVPKGPSLDTQVKRLAVQTEDHPVEYGSFEGAIPEGEYGGGTVLLWDRGTWEPDGDARAQYAKGRLSFTLHGERLKGKWHLVRTRSGDSGAQNWLLFKGTDEEASSDGERLVKTETRSVTTRRTLDEIRADASRASKKSSPTKAASSVKASSAIAAAGTPVAVGKPRSERKRGSRTKTSSQATAALPVLGTVAKLPATLDVERATLVTAVPTGDEWVHELKLDGYRIVARVQRGAIELMTRNGKSFSERAPSVVASLARLPVQEALLDGEIVALRDDGVSDFQLLQNALSTGESGSLVYYAFDLLHLNGRDLRALPLEERKGALKQLLGMTPSEHVRLSDHVSGEGQRFFDRACAAGLEGIVCKLRRAPYRSGKSRDWLKVKCSARQEFVIVGFTEPEGSRSYLGALLVGVWADDQLVYSGKVGTGFTQKSLAALHSRLKPLQIAKSALANPPRGAESRGVHWVKPTLVAEVQFTEFTSDGRLRHPTFRGLREDKPARDVIRELPARAASATAAAPASMGRKTAALKPSSSASHAVPPLGELPKNFRLTSPEKVLYQKSGITKLDLASYYATVAAWMLPHIADRPLTLVRCPQGQEKGCFFQKHAQKGQSTAIHKVPISEEDGSTSDYTSIDSLDGLMALAQMGALELHTWGAHVSDPERPDLMVFDLDPDPDLPWARVVQAATLLRSLFEQLDLQSFVKTTGGKGLHVCIPFSSRLDWDGLKRFCQAVANAITQQAPEHYLATMSKAQRKHKIFIDYLRNGRGATFIAPYSTRARPGAPIAVPVFWEELPDVRSDSFTLQNLSQRLAGLKEDPWREITKIKQPLTLARLKSVDSAARTLKSES